MAQRDLVRAGFIPLIDAAPLIAACVKGFAEGEGLELVLTRETSWATIRDRLAVGHLDAAHTLAPMPIASNLGLAPISQPLIAPMALGFGGNTFVISHRHWPGLEDRGCAMQFDPVETLTALRAYICDRAATDSPRLVFGIVHPHSAHRYCLAYWLATGGLIDGRDFDFVVLPPPLMPSALASGSIDGFCAGEPWGSVARAEDAGVILTTMSHIWRSSPEKVLSVRREWAESSDSRLSALVRAIAAAAHWCDRQENRSELAELLSQADAVGRSADLIETSLARKLVAPSGDRVGVSGFLTFADGCATFPWVSHALWFAAQMARWNEIELTPDTIAKARATYRPDLFRRAFAGMSVDLPAANAKVEGAVSAELAIGSTRGGLVLSPDGFFDGLTFDPDDIAAYVAALGARDEMTSAEGRSRS